MLHRAWRWFDSPFLPEHTVANEMHFVDLFGGAGAGRGPGSGRLPLRPGGRLLHCEIGTATGLNRRCDRIHEEESAFCLHSQ